jgi:hypothetical protein
MRRFGEWRQGVNFTNILRAPYSYKSFVRSFFVLAVKVNFLFAQEYWRNCANKMLVKLTQGWTMSKIITEYNEHRFLS